MAKKAKMGKVTAESLDLASQPGGGWIKNAPVGKVGAGIANDGWFINPPKSISLGHEGSGPSIGEETGK